jgi:hypothetical protein
MKVTVSIKEVIVSIEDAEMLLTSEDPQPRNRRRRRTAEEIAAAEATATETHNGEVFA